MTKKRPKRRSPAAAKLSDPRYRPRKVPSKRAYNRRAPTTSRELDRALSFLLRDLD